ncbi:MAG: 4'-phosphopantetheinyl transferase superfamily protein [Methylovulum sp.]|nr:4'-phosphopantetheinyl transferase superfamily protein [Methylovulum sp.]
MTLELPTGSIHLWLAFPDEINDEALLSSYGRLLNEEEKKRWQRFHFARHRHQYLVTRALIRSTLSRYVDIDPADWRFSFNNHGKPEILSALADKPIRFNLSHTNGLVMCAIVLENDIGVDIEDMQRKPATLDIAGHFFSRQEAEDLHNLPESGQSRRFFEYWTLKEAYIKARGMGLALPLKQFGFMISENQPVQISFDPRMEDNPAHWQFWQLWPSENHIAAIAVKSETNMKFQLLMNKVIPLQ